MSQVLINFLVSLEALSSLIKCSSDKAEICPGCLGLVHLDDPEGWYGEGGGRRVQDGDLSEFFSDHVENNDRKIGKWVENTLWQRRPLGRPAEPPHFHFSLSCTGEGQSLVREHST